MRYPVIECARLFSGSPARVRIPKTQPISITLRLRALILIPTALLLSQIARSEVKNFQRDFLERLTSLSVVNPDGVTEVYAWDDAATRVIALRAQGPALDSEISFEHQSGRLTVRATPKAPDTPLTLILFVPHSTNVSIRSTVGRVSVTGSLAGVFVETESGAVTLQLPEAPDIDISLRTLEGSIESSVPLDIFGKRNVRALDARIGSGGSTAIVRTRSGNIKLAANATKPPDAISAKANDPQRHASGPQQAHNALRPASAARTLEGEAGIRTGDEVIRLEARLVNVLVKVTDAGGKALPALTRDDFLVYEDDARQDISYFEPVTAPLHIVLLLDLSGSTEKKMKIMKRAAQKFVDSLKPADTIAVAAFTRRFFVISNFTKDHKLLKDRIGDIKNRHAGTAFYDAMWATLDLLDEAGAGRRAIVVLTDGVDNSLDHPDDQELAARHDFDELLSRVEEADATIYPIYLDTEYETIGRGGRGGHDAYVTARKQLQALADQTGAVMFKAERAEDLEAAYGQVAAELHSLYSLAYAPKKLIRDGEWRRIRVEVNLSGAKLRAKRGYYAR